MIVTALPMTASAEDTVTVIEVSTAEELTAACNTINDSGGTYTIRLTDIVTGGQLEVTHANAVVTLIGNGKTISSIGTAVYVSGGATVTPGDDQSAAQSDPGLYINGGTITDNTAVGTYDKTYAVQGKGLGGGVLATGMESKVRIHNAEISSNKAEYGAGVAAHHYYTNPDIDNCMITANVAEKNGGGIMLVKNTVGTFVKNTTVTGNTSGDRGAGIYYDTDSKLTISGANTVQENYYNGVLNNLNVLSKAKPVYVNGDLTGSKIGLSDPTLWDDGKTDEDPQAVSTEYLTNGYKANNPEVHPEEYFTSDHETWYVDRSAKTSAEVEDTSLKNVVNIR
ncbi:MAG: hypothetical protein IJR57_02330 [Ruminococcus sp.]|nr:hypothetical protein [Ruminococcus sp.]